MHFFPTIPNLDFDCVILAIVIIIIIIIIIILNLIPFPIIILIINLIQVIIVFFQCTNHGLFLLIVIHKSL